MKTIRAVTLKAFGGPDMLQISQVPVVSLPSSKDVLIRIMAAGVNRADLSQRRGHYPPPKGSSDILGLEASGVVVKTGRDVKRFKEGDRVMALLSGGGYADMAVAHEGSVMKIPEGYSFIEAAAIPEAFITAWQALKTHGNVKKGECVLIHAGASGVGTAVMQVADKCFGAKVIATCSAEKVDFCKKFASVAVERTPDESGSCFANKVRDVVGEEAVNVIIDPVVGGTYLEEDGKVLAQDGRIVLIAYMGGRRVSLDISALLRKRATVIFTRLREQTNEYKASLVEELEREVIPYMRDRIIQPVVQRTFPIEDVADAHILMESNKSNGKIILTLGDFGKK